LAACVVFTLGTIAATQGAVKVDKKTGRGIPEMSVREPIITPARALHVDAASRL
jgi:hypothetical protein